jgi:DNA-binding response OmpR family regulator
MAMRLLIVEDEPKLAGFMQQGLTEEGYAASSSASLASLLGNATSRCAIRPAIVRLGNRHYVPGSGL